MHISKVAASCSCSSDLRVALVEWHHWRLLSFCALTDSLLAGFTEGKFPVSMWI